MTKFLGGCLVIIFFFSACNSGSDNLINGFPAPDVALPNAENEIIELSSLKGNIVLIDFWASWCKPCRKDNPKIVAIYNKYKKESFENAEGFEVFSISLDSKKEKWLKAIEADKLDWPYHVSELTAWKSSAVDSYNISSIPATFLIDQDGIIIGKDLRHQDLDKILSLRLAK